MNKIPSALNLGLRRGALEIKQFTRQQKEISHLQSFVDRFRFNSKRASIAQDRVKKINRMVKINGYYCYY